MIRKVELQDTRSLTDIYNYYIAHSTATFDITPIGEEEMRKRIVNISTRYPYFVYENEGKITGYCYAHPINAKAYRNMPPVRIPFANSLHHRR